mmetsp:Transcript_11859/g.12899  ORF Transcript_11859/g.12899 Transcript_11859/m.12899 type:complete len:200 (-) Transcript_11859:60-659(-)
MQPKTQHHRGSSHSGLSNSQQLHIFNFKGLNKEIIQTKQCHSISLVKAQHKCFHVVGSFLQVTNVRSVLGIANFYASSLGIHPDLQFHVLHNGVDERHPGCLQRRHPVGGYWNTAHLLLHTLLFRCESRKLRLAVGHIAVSFCFGLIDCFYHDILHFSWLKNNSILGSLPFSTDWSIAAFCRFIEVIIHRHRCFNSSSR